MTTQTTTTDHRDVVAEYPQSLFAYENGELDETETLDLFQHLVDTGVVWLLQGRYGREAVALLDAGLITLPEGAR